MTRQGKRRRQKSTGRNAVSLIFSFFLSLSLLALTVLLIARFGILSESRFLSTLDDAYYQYTLNYINEQTGYYTLPTGLASSVLDDVFTVSEVRSDVNANVVNAFRHVDSDIDTTHAEERLSANVAQFFSDNGVEASEETQQITDTYVDEIMDIYRTAVRMPGLDAIVKVRDIFMRYFPFALIALLALSVVLIVTLLRLHHFVHRGMRYVAYATGGAALMSFVVPFMLYHSGFYRGLKLTPQFFYHFGVSFIEHVLKTCLLGSLVLLVVTIALIVVINVMRKQAKRHHSSSHFE